MHELNPYLVGALAAPAITAFGAAAVAATLWAAHEVQEAWLRGHPWFTRDHGDRAKLAAAVATCTAVAGFKLPGIPGTVLLAVGRANTNDALNAEWKIKKTLEETPDE